MTITIADGRWALWQWDTGRRDALDALLSGATA